MMTTSMPYRYVIVVDFSDGSPLMLVGNELGNPFPSELQANIYLRSLQAPAHWVMQVIAMVPHESAQSYVYQAEQMHDMAEMECERRLRADQEAEIEFAQTMCDFANSRLED